MRIAWRLAVLVVAQELRDAAEPSPERAADVGAELDDQFYDGELLDFRLFLANRVLAGAAMVALVAIGVREQFVRKRVAWIAPFSVAMLAWRVALVGLNLRWAPSPSPVAMVALVPPLALPVVQTGVTLAFALVSAATLAVGCAPAALRVHTALYAVVLLSTGMHFESTSVHWLCHQAALVASIGLLEIALGCVHLLCGLQKLNASYFAVGFMDPEMWTTDGIDHVPFPLPFLHVLTDVAPVVEIAGGVLVLVGCRWRSMRCAGNAMLFGYHAGAGLMLLCTMDTLVYSYNLVCAAVALRALLHLDEPVHPPWRPLLFAVVLLTGALPLMNVLFGDTPYGWRPSGSMNMYAGSWPRSRACWPRAHQFPATAGLAMDDEHCVDWFAYGMLLPSQSSPDVDFASAATRFWAAYFGEAAELRLESPGRFGGLSQQAVRCTADACVGSWHVHGLLIAALLAGGATYCWPNSADPERSSHVDEAKPLLRAAPLAETRTGGESPG